MTYAISPRSATRDALLAACYFALSTVITWWFIKAGSGLYASRDKMLLSCGIAGGKWALQIGGALLLLREERWVFIRRLGAVCLAGSVVLLPYCHTHVRAMIDEPGFAALLIGAVALMIVLYWRAVHRTGLKPAWFWAWMACLLAAITLQLTVVFG